MVDKIMTLKRSRLTDAMGTLSGEEIELLDRALGRWLALPVS